MGADAAKDERVASAMKGYAVGHRDAGFPNIFEALHFFDAEGGMRGVLHQPRDGFFRACLDFFGEPPKVPGK